MTDSQTRAVLDRAREALTALEHVIGYAAGLEAERDKLIRWHREDNTQMTGAYREAAQFLAERNQALARVAELEERDALLSALEAAGVDNWEGYDTAREIAGEAS